MKNHKNAHERDWKASDAMEKASHYSKAGNISFKLVCVEFAKQQGQAKREYESRMRGFYTKEGQEQLAKERAERIAAYQEKNGNRLPSFQSEKRTPPNIPSMGWEKAQEYCLTPTRVEQRKPFRKA